MIRFVIKRFFYGTLVMLGLTVVIFFIFHALPGNPVDVLVGNSATLEQREDMAKELGLDKPLLVQLGYYLNDLSPIGIHATDAKTQQEYDYTTLFSLSDNTALVLKYPYLRRSFQSREKVSTKIMGSLGGTIILAFSAMIIATFLGVSMGIIAALNKGKALDHFILTASVVGISVPSFVAAICITMFFGYYLHEYTGLNTTGYLWEYDLNTGREELHLKNLILPAFTLGIRPLSVIVQLTRNSMLEVLSQDYIRTAKAKGLPFYRVIMKHALKNALNPVITAVSGWLATLLAGAFFVEKIFDWKGIGNLIITSVIDRDMPVVIGSTLVVGLMFIIVNIVVDILYAAVDPRVRIN